MTGSWAPRPVTRRATPQLHAWATPHPDWPVALVWLTCVVLVALLLLAVDQGRALMCDLHATPDNPAPLTYCNDYTPARAEGATTT